MSDNNYVEICRGEVAKLQEQLGNYGPDVHIFEKTGNGPFREITDELRESLRHGIATYERIIAALSGMQSGDPKHQP